MNNKMGYYLDRLCAAGAGIVGVSAADSLAGGDVARGVAGLPAVAFLAWLSTSETGAWRRDLYRVTATDRERLRGVLRNVYGDTKPFPGTYISRTVATNVLGDAYGTPVTWCREPEAHRPHLWPINGPAFAPALCMGHDCVDYERHMK